MRRCSATVLREASIDSSSRASHRGGNGKEGMMENLVDRFLAVDDDGKEYTVFEYREIIEDNKLEAGGPRLGLPRFALDDGSAVTLCDAETFKIVLTDKIIRKVS
jgi:hypothetical protein